MFSDIFYLKETPYILRLFNIDYIRKNKHNLKKQQLINLEVLAEEQANILTNDILALLNVFKHFSENQNAKQYINQQVTSFSNKKYVNDKYLQNKHFFLENTYCLIQELKKEND